MSFKESETIEAAFEILDRLTQSWSPSEIASFKAIVKIGMKYPQYCPLFTESKNMTKNTLEEKTAFWANKYKGGSTRRTSAKTANPVGTKVDMAISAAIHARLPHLKEENLQAITDAHRIAMSAENLVGPLLEEYLDSKLHEQGWHSCWGNSLRDIDFCKEDEKGVLLLQVKNSDNSENNASRQVREGTPILKWSRRNSKKATTRWDDLEELTGVQGLSEEEFINFLSSKIEKNPAMFHIDPEDSWAK